jgi:hypothetical protein
MSDLLPDGFIVRIQRLSHSVPPVNRKIRKRCHSHAECCPRARDFLEYWVRWATICAKWQFEHCEQAAAIVSTVAERNRR